MTGDTSVLDSAGTEPVVGIRLLSPVQVKVSTKHRKTVLIAKKC